MNRPWQSTILVVCGAFLASSLITSALPQRPARFDRLWGHEFQPNTEADVALRELRRHRTRVHPQQARGMIHHWNEIAIDAAGLDHTPPLAGEQRVFGQQMGPGRSSRAIAIVQIAVFDAVTAIAGGYRTYSSMPSAPAWTSMEAAVAQAAHDTLAAMFPSQAVSFAEELAADLQALPEGPATQAGLRIGQHAAALILRRHSGNGSSDDPQMDVDFISQLDPGKWRQDPIGLQPVALGATWGAVTPFVIPSGQRFRVPPPPPLASPEYAEAYNEVKRLGGDGIRTPTERSEEQSFIGVFWAYDGTPSLCAPPRLYNQIAMTIADQMGTNAVDLARLLALVNVAMSDAGIAIWESKFHYQFWRPITAIREADKGLGPTGLGDGNPNTVADVTFTPLGAPASNLTGPNFTPPFPSYPSGHAGFGGALFQILRRFYGTDAIPFTFVSDEFNGETRDNTGQLRPRRPRSFNSLSEAEEENGQSRIYLGIHFAFDKTDGIDQGRRVADYVYRNAFTPYRRR